MNEKCKEFSDRFEALEEEANGFFRGKKVKIISNYNGQVYGASKKPLTGKTVTIRNVCLENGLSFGCEELRVYLGSDEVEFIESKERKV